MVRKFVFAVILMPVAAVLVGFAVANRQPVMVSFDPFESDPAHALTVPLYLLGFAVLVVGVLLGGSAAWIEQGKSRRARARLAAETRALRAELEALRRPERRALPPLSTVKRPPAA
jgi:hypothetical protein